MGEGSKLWFWHHCISGCVAERIKYTSRMTEARTHSISSHYQQLMLFIELNYWTHFMIVLNELVTKSPESYLNICCKDFLNIQTNTSYCLVKEVAFLCVTIFLWIEINSFSLPFHQSQKYLFHLFFKDSYVLYGGLRSLVYWNTNFMRECFFMY